MVYTYGGCCIIFEFSDISQSIHKDGFWQSLIVAFERPAPSDVTITNCMSNIHIQNCLSDLDIQKIVLGKIYGWYLIPCYWKQNYCQSLKRVFRVLIYRTDQMPTLAHPHMLHTARSHSMYVGIWDGSVGVWRSSTEVIEGSFYYSCADSCCMQIDSTTYQDSIIWCYLCPYR